LNITYDIITALTGSDEYEHQYDDHDYYWFFHANGNLLACVFSPSIIVLMRVEYKDNGRLPAIMEKYVK